jgi:hemolysin activation/secretion protein
LPTHLFKDILGILLCTKKAPNLKTTAKQQQQQQQQNEQRRNNKLKS